MKPLFIGQPGPGQKFETWIKDSLKIIETQSYESIEAVVDDFTVSNFTATRTLNAGTATLADLANFVATLIDDIKDRGQKGT